MDANLNPTDKNEKLDDVSVDLLTAASKSPIVPDNSTAGHTENREPSVDNNLQKNPTGGLTRAVSLSSSYSVEKDQAKPPCVPSPACTEACMEACTVYEVSQSFTSISRSQKSLKSTAVHTEPDGDDLCAAVLLACLFCHPLDCLMATMRGCNGCVWWLCSALCGCEPTTLQPLLDVIHHCDVCGCLDVRCFLWDCPICDVCLQATECLDLAMEISQMLYH